jgi:hypothetical protein
MYHATGPNETDKLGRKVTHDITFARHTLNLTYLLGCAKQTWCLWCVNETDKGNIMTLAKPAWNDTVVNSKRRNNPRAAIITGTTFRYDLFKGPFTVGDALAIVPYTDTFHYAEVDFQTYLRVLKELNITRSSTGSIDELLQDNEESDWSTLMLQGSHSKQHALLSNVLGEPPLTPGYVTFDDFGADGDAATTGKYVSISCSEWDGLKRLSRIFRRICIVWIRHCQFLFHIDRIAKNSTTKAMPQFPIVVSTAVPTKRS